MASPIVAGVRAGMSPRDSAGSPSPTSPQQVTTASEQAREYFAAAAAGVSKDLNRSGTAPTEAFFSALMKMNEAAPRVHTAIQAAIKVLPDDTDADSSLAVLELADEAARKFCSDVFNVGTLACLASKVQPAQSYDRLAFDAAAQIEAIGRMLRREVEQDGFESVLNSALIRINDLASVLLSLHGGDDTRDRGEMHDVVFGAPMEVANHG